MELFEALSALERKRDAAALVTIIGSRGTVSRKSGRMAVAKDGRCWGTVGGGSHEAEAKRIALEAIRDGRNRRETIRVRETGEIDIMVDVVVRDRCVVIAGAGHVGAALASLFHVLGWRTVVLDTREGLLASPSFAFSSTVLLEKWEDLEGNVVMDGNTAFISTIPEANNAFLPFVLGSDVFYIGFLSSSRRVFPTDRRIHAPAGLDLGDETPEEIALSMASEVLAAFNGRSGKPRRDRHRSLVIVRGAGDLASGTILRLISAGYPVIALEIDKPTVIRRTVSFSTCLYDGECVVEGVKAKRVESPEEALAETKKGIVPVLVDPDGLSIKALRPGIVVDAIMAKRNLGTTIDMAPLVIALGPGFTAGTDCHCVIETRRGHRLGRVIRDGSAEKNTGIPGVIGGYGKERVIHSECSGIFCEAVEIGDIVEKGDIIAYVGGKPVAASISGRLRGLLHSGLEVPEGFKIADIDPRGVETDHTTVSDKARSIGGAVLEAVCAFLNG